MGGKNKSGTVHAASTSAWPNIYAIAIAAIGKVTLVTVFAQAFAILYK